SGTPAAALLEWIPQKAARARVGSGHQEKAGRIGHGVGIAGEGNLPLLQGLAQRLQTFGAKLRQLVQEEHAPVRQGDFAGPKLCSTAYQSRQGDAVMGSPK